MSALPQAVPARRAARRSSAKLRRRIATALLGLTLFTVVAFVAGFAAFVLAVGRPAPADPHADGIVVLTGAGARIDGAVQLLAEGRADRLLISGVNPMVSEGALARTLDAARRPLLSCCVDLDREAEDTIGNARATGRWALQRGYRSLIVVTSDYHMPRSLAEMAGAMPGALLVPYPITDAAAHPVLRPATLRVLVSEYVKYLGARVRLLVDRPATRPALAEVAVRPAR